MTTTETCKQCEYYRSTCGGISGGAGTCRSFQPLPSAHMTATGLAMIIAVLGMGICAILARICN